MKQLKLNHIYQGDTLEVLKTFPDESVDCIITSPPYWGLRDYRVEGQIGLESTLEEYIEKILKITNELKRVLKKTGVMFWNHGSSYQDKCDTMQNYRLILKMIDEQKWTLRDTIIWAKKIWIAKENKSIGNAMPCSVRDRCNFTYEPIFMLVKNKKYFFDLEILKVPYTKPLNRWGGNKLKVATNKSSVWDKLTNQSTYRDRNLRPDPLGSKRPNVWQVNTKPLKLLHCAAYPTTLIEDLIKVGCPQWVCKKCNKPRERIIKIKYLKKRENKRNKKPREELGKVMQEVPTKGWLTEKLTVGWTDCGCNYGWKSGIVLDPFMGSGTTAVVAQSLGRNWIGIELNPEYIKMAYKRIEDKFGVFIKKLE